MVFCPKVNKILDNKEFLCPNGEVKNVQLFDLWGLYELTCVTTITPDVSFQIGEVLLQYPRFEHYLFLELGHEVF